MAVLQIFCGIIVPKHLKYGEITCIPWDESP